MLDTGTTLGVLSQTYAEAICGTVPAYQIPCDTRLNVSFVFGDMEYPVHPIDSVIAAVSNRVPLWPPSHLGSFRYVSSFSTAYTNKIHFRTQRTSSSAIRFCATCSTQQLRLVRQRVGLGAVHPALEYNDSYTIGLAHNFFDSTSWHYFFCDMAMPSVMSSRASLFVIVNKTNQCRPPRF
ncbi:hypothetical protein DFH11DRAFT_810620 [Phellopilus nigrolimitatus]|nr:hypothetical protein DFH11DRAFT_810620 [Phellopilus nigrolimitatus]